MGRRGNPCGNARAVSFMKTLKVKAVYSMDYEAVADVAETIPHFIDEAYNSRLTSKSQGSRCFCVVDRGARANSRTVAHGRIAGAARTRPLVALGGKGSKSRLMDGCCERLSSPGDRIVASPGLA
jgi:hypothetical protein